MTWASQITDITTLCSAISSVQHEKQTTKLRITGTYWGGNSLTWGKYCGIVFMSWRHYSLPVCLLMRIPRHESDAFPLAAPSGELSAHRFRAHGRSVVSSATSRNPQDLGSGTSGNLWKSFLHIWTIDPEISLIIGARARTKTCEGVTQQTSVSVSILWFSELLCIILFIKFDIHNWQRHIAGIIPVKHECNSIVQIHAFVKTTMILTEEITDPALVTPAHAINGMNK